MANTEQLKRPVRLTEFAHCAGCAAKVNFRLLSEILSHVDLYRSADTLVGPDTYDDAGVYRIGPDTALVQTVDFFPPIVDDPVWFGRIAAVNAMSDVYAMGGVPLTALNIVAFPTKQLPAEVLRDILHGGAMAFREAGVTLLGGHTIEDAEPKYGAAVTGLVNPARMTTIQGARPGDALVLTKPLGVGLMVTGLRERRLTEEEAQPALDSMAMLNRAASRVMLDFSAHACTDITGFGLMGHALNLAEGSGVSLHIRAADVPVFEPARRMAREGLFPGGSQNREVYGPRVSVASSVPADLAAAVFDPQTSGGLLVSLPGERAHDFLQALLLAGVDRAAIIGEVRPAAETGSRVEVH